MSKLTCLLFGALQLCSDHDVPVFVKFKAFDAKCEFHVKDQQLKKYFNAGAQN